MLILIISYIFSLWKKNIWWFCKISKISFLWNTNHSCLVDCSITSYTLFEIDTEVLSRLAREAMRIITIVTWIITRINNIIACFIYFVIKLLFVICNRFCWSCKKFVEVCWDEYGWSFLAFAWSAIINLNCIADYTFFAG